MRKIILKFLAVLSLSLLFAPSLPNVVLAADNTAAFKASNFKVDVKPEYDDPRTLVIYSTDLYAVGNETVKKGTAVTFIIPKDAQIGMACEVNAQGGHDCQPYSSKDLGDGRVELSWKASKDIAAGQKYPVFLEFYYDTKAVAPNKSFAYNFYPTFNTDSLALSFTQPKSASGFQLDPPASGTSQDQDGLTNYVESFTNKAPKDTVTIKVSYTKGDNKPTFDKPQVGGQQTNATPKSSSGDSWYKNPSVLIPLILFLVAMAVLIIYAVRNPKQPDKAATNYSPVKASKNKPTPTKSSGEERRKLRQALLDGRISEETYKEMVADLDD